MTAATRTRGPRRRGPLARTLVLLAVGFSSAAALVACGSAAPGDCTTAPDSDGDVSTVSCTDSTAQRRILQILDAGGDCISVAGVSDEVGSGSGDRTMCLGPKDVQPERAVNVADVGDCLTEITTEPVLRTSCSAPGAYRILSRDSNVIVPGLNECADAPGSSDSYQWTMADPRFPALKRGFHFCLNRADVDASRSVDRAKVGDCLAPTTSGGQEDYLITPCSDARATDRVVARSDNPFLTGDLACRDAPDATSSVSRRQGMKGYVLCLAPA